MREDPFTEVEADMKEDLPMTATAQLRLVPGSGSVLESLFTEHYDPIYRTAYRVTGNATDAEDVLQTIFMRLARRNDELDLKPNPRAYLLRAAINAGLDVVRSRSGAQLVPLEDIAPLVTSDNPESIHASSETKRMLRKELSKLSRKSAEMFVLRYFEGLDNREIAELMGTSHLVVGVMLHRARAHMKKTLFQ